MENSSVLSCVVTSMYTHILNRLRRTFGSSGFGSVMLSRQSTYLRWRERGSTAREALEMARGVGTIDTGMQNIKDNTYKDKSGTHQDKTEKVDDSNSDSERQDKDQIVQKRQMTQTQSTRTREDRAETQDQTQSTRTREDRAETADDSNSDSEHQDKGRTQTQTQTQTQSARTREDRTETAEDSDSDHQDKSEKHQDKSEKARQQFVETVLPATRAPPGDDELGPELRSLLKGRDFDTLTSRQARIELEQRLSYHPGSFQDPKHIDAFMQALDETVAALVNEEAQAAKCDVRDDDEEIEDTDTRVISKSTASHYRAELEENPPAYLLR